MARLLSRPVDKQITEVLLIEFSPSDGNELTLILHPGAVIL